MLQHQHKQLVQMNELLLCEREAFASREPVKVEAINKQKLAAIQELQDTDQQITNQYDAKDFESAEIEPIKIEIDNLLSELKMQNEVNGKILQGNQTSLNMLKEILIGSKRNNSATTYNQSGKKSAALMSRPIKA